MGLWTRTSALPHLTLQDTAGSVWAVLVFAAVLYAPGYLVGYASNLFCFRRLGFADRSLWAIAYSFLVAPVAGHLLGRIAGLHGVELVFSSAALLCLVSLLAERRMLRWTRSQRRLTAAVAGCWTLLVLLLLIDLQVGHKLYFSVVMADQSYRIAFTDAVLRTGVPPANPLYFGGSFAPMRYYYFWYVLCGAVAQLGHVSSRQAFVASSIWAGFGLLAVTWLFGGHFFHWPSRQRWLGVGLLLVGGADLLPAAGQAILQPALNGDTEWWSVDPIDSWPDSLLWVPHHVASALCCLLAFLLLWKLRGREGLTTGHRWWAVLLTASGFASACGLSVYVAFGFALLMTGWLGWLIVQRTRDCWQMLRNTVAAALLSAVLLLPFLLELVAGTEARTAHGEAHAGSAGVFTFSVRRMIDSGLLTGLPVFAHLDETHPVLLDQLLRLVLLLPGLAMELGLYGAVLVLLLRHRQSVLRYGDIEARGTSLFFVVSGLFLTMFLSSAVITNNDFGYRAVMLPQFFLLLLTADLLGSWWKVACEPVLAPTPLRRGLLTSLLVLGIAGMVYWAVLLRAWLPLEVHLPQHGFASLPEDAFQIREAFATLDHHAAPGDVVAFRPIDPTPDRQGEVMAPNEYYQRMLVMDANLQMLNAERKCAVHFGGDPDLCPQIQRQTALLYALPAPNEQWAHNYCQQFGVHYLVLSAWDPDWRVSQGWPTTLPVLVKEPRIRIFSCR